MRLGGRVTQRERRAGQHLELVGVPSVGRGAALHIGVVTLARLERPVQREQGIGVLGTEVATVVGITGLQQHRVALRPGGQRGDAADAELPPVAFDAADALRIGIDVGVDVGDHGLRCPAVPEPPRHGDEFLRPVVAVGMGEKSAAAEVFPGERIRGGDHVPGRPPIGQVIQRRELPCHPVRFVERGVDGASKAEVVGDRCERGQHREGVGPADDVEVVNLAAMLTQPQTLGQEEEIEQSSFG